MGRRSFGGQLDRRIGRENGTGKGNGSERERRADQGIHRFFPRWMWKEHSRREIKPL